MDYLNVWLMGYGPPKKFIIALRAKPAPHWGLYAQVWRGLMDSLLIYLPVTLLGRHPLDWSLLFISTLAIVVIFISGLHYFRRMERLFADVV